MPTHTESAEQPSAPDPTEAFQSTDENEQRAADAKGRGISGAPSQPLSEASETTTLIDSPEEPSTSDHTEGFQSRDQNEQRAVDAERRGISGVPSQPLSEASESTTLLELAEQPRAPDSQCAVDAARRGISGAPQPLSEASETTTLIDSPEEPSTPGPTEALHSNDAETNRVVKILKALERAAYAKRRGIGGTSGQPLSRPSEVSTLTASLQEPSTPDPTEAIQSRDENGQRAVDAERRDISGVSSQPLSEASQTTTLTESAEQPSATDPTEAIQLKDENEQRAVDAKRRDIGGVPSQPLSEASQVTTLTESAEQPTTPDPTEATQAKDENEQRAADAERRDISRTLSQQLSEAREVTARIESVEQKTAHDSTEAVQNKDENEQHAADRDSSGTRSQPLSEASQAATPAELAEAPTTPDPSEAIQAKDENEQRAEDAELHSNDAEKARVANVLKSLERSADVKRRRIGGTSGQPLSRPSKVSTLTGSPQESSAPNWTETFKRKDTAKDRLVRFVKALKGAANAKRRGSSETLDQPVYGRTEVSMGPFSSPSAPDSSQEPSTPDLSEAFHSKDADKDRLIEIPKALERSADANPRGVDGTPSQSPSAPTAVRTSTDAPAKLSTLDLAKGFLAEGFHSIGAYKDRVVSVLKALMKRSRDLIADAPRSQQAEETDLAMTLSVMPDPVSPDKRGVQELESHDREPKPQLGSAGQDQVFGTEISAPIDNHVYQGSFAVEQQTRPHDAFGMNPQPAPAAPTDLVPSARAASALTHQLLRRRGS